MARLLSDRIGKIFGDFKVLSYIKQEKRWNCECTRCGEKRKLATASLRGKIKCLCYQDLKSLVFIEKNKNELINQKFSRLRVKEYVGKDKYGANIWRCQCDCGNRIDAIQSSLKRGTVRSCGCLKKEMHQQNKKSDGLARTIFRDYQRAAKDNNRRFELSLEECKIFFKQNCYYCGSEPLQEKKYAPCREVSEEARNEIYLFNGIDRINNNEGYIKDNIRASCRVCNIMKAKQTEEEFYSWIARLIKHQDNPRILPIEKELVILKEEKWKNHTEARGEMYRQRTLKPGEAVYNKILDEYKRKAASRSIDFELDSNKFKEKLLNNCKYCGIEPNRRIDIGRCSPFVVWVNGIDRIDNSRGYTTDNCVTACHNCNHAKNTYSASDFLLHIQKIHDNLVGKNILVKD